MEEQEQVIAIKAKNNFHDQVGYNKQALSPELAEASVLRLLLH